VARAATRIGAREKFTAILEAKVGGRWYERRRRRQRMRLGTRAGWERRTACDELGHQRQWKHEPEHRNEVEVTVHRRSRERTRVELEHRKIERYGDKAEAMQGFRFPRRRAACLARDGGTVKRYGLLR